MITITKQNDGVLFTFQNSDKYLYGNGTIEVPFNTLSIIADESDMITLKKAASNDVFLSARYDTDLGYRSKDDAIDDLKGMLFAETGGGSESGITPSEVQDMIDSSISGKADTAVVNQAISEATQAILSVSGDVQTKVATSDFNTYTAATETALNGKVDTSALNDYYTKTEVYNKQEVDTAYETAYQALTAHTADTSIHVTSAEKTTWNNKSDFSGDYNDLTNKPTIPTVPTNISDFTNDAGYITNADITDKADTSAVTAVNDALTAHTANTTVHVTSAEKTAWNAKQDALYIYTEDNNLGTAELHSNDSSIIFNAGGASITANNAMGVNTFNVASTGVTINGENVLTDGIISTAITSGSTDSEIPTAKATYDAIQAGGGGGATYSAGTNISIANDTINCTLPITANSATSSTFIAGNPSRVVNENILIGSTSLFRSNYKDNVVIGTFGTKASNDCVVIGRNATGGTNNNYDWYNVAIGSLANANGGNHVALGYSATATGTTKMNLNNQITVDTNNQVYIKDKTNTTDVCIQDAIAALGGLKLVSLSQSDYDSLVSGGTVDSSTIYFITNVVS